MKAVSLGVLVDILGTLAVIVVISAIYGGYLASQGVSVPDIQARMQQESLSPIRMLLMAGGCGFSVLAGYVCGRIARRREYRLALVTALVSSFIGTALSASELLSDPVRFSLTLLLTVACTLLGGYLAARRRGMAMGR